MQGCRVSDPGDPALLKALPLDSECRFSKTNVLHAHLRLMVSVPAQPGQAGAGIVNHPGLN